MALVHNGIPDQVAMSRELVTREDLAAALRETRIAHVHEARFAMLEATGKITAGHLRPG